MNRHFLLSLPVLIGLALGAVTLAGCSTNPATGKQSFTGFMSPAEERSIGAKEHPKLVKAFGGEYRDPVLKRYLDGLGLHQVMLSAWAGARVIAVDTVAEKFEACREAGASECVDAGAGDVIEALMEFTGGKGVDVAIDYVSATATLSQAFASLGVRGRMVTLGGAGETFEADAMQLLVKELDVLGSRDVTKFEVHQALELVARGEVWPLVSEIRAMEEAETIHALVEQGGITGRAAILIG